MKCVSCGTELQEGTLICPQCGTVVNQSDVVRQQAAARKLTKTEFYKLDGMKACRNNIRVCAIVLYFCAGATALVSLLADLGVSSSLIDAVVLLALGLWLQFGKSRVASILATAYGVFSMVVVMMATGKVQGWLIPLAGAYGIVYTFKFHKLWSKYQKDGILPEEAVSAKK